jgi:hypothetical protein
LTEGDPKVDYFCVDDEGALWFKDRLVVPKNHELHKKMFGEAHTSKYSIHPDSTNMYHDLKAQFLWTRMKRETARYVTKCDMCQRVKTDHMRPVGLLQPLNISSWKWEDIGIDFIMGLSARKFDFIWVIMHWFTKFAHFIPMYTNYMAEKYNELYIARILGVHGVLKTIISDRGPQFVAHFLEQVHASLGMHLIHSSDYHP